jgi:hypothetical protein
LTSTGEIVITGAFTSAQLDFYNGKNVLASQGQSPAFAAKLTPAGYVSWAVAFGGQGAQHPTAMTVVGNRTVIAGDFADTIDLGPAGKPALLKATDDVFFTVALQIADGAPEWGSGLPRKGATLVHAIASDGAGKVALTGEPVFVAEIGASDGKPSWRNGYGDAMAVQSGSGVAYGASGLFLAGHFTGTLDLGNQLTPLMSAGGADMFVAKLCP